MINVLIVEDQRMAREYMEQVVEGTEGYNLTASISGASLAAMHCMSREIDLVLMDICTENNESGLTACAEVKKKSPGTKVIIVTSAMDPDFLRRAVEAGADSFWHKEAPQDELSSVIARTMAGEHIFPDAMPTVKIGSAVSCDFTEKELAVLRLLVPGLSYREIAEQLHYSEVYVKKIVTSMLKKTDHPNRVSLAVDVAVKKLIINGF